MPNRENRFLSPAKVNLTFKVVRNRGDGYHDIETLMQAVSLCDWVSLLFSDKDLLTCSDPNIPTDRSNLVWRAIDIYRKHTGFNCPLQIHIDKQIPAQAGLGGGSSNAATALYAINQLSPAPVSLQLLRTWAALIDSDASFFFSSGSAFCTGRGENVSSCALPEELPQWIVHPKDLSMSTPSVYAHCAIGESLEPAAFKVEPKLALIKQQLIAEGCDDVRLTGSGSAFICYGTVKPQIKHATTYSIRPLQKKTDAWYDYAYEQSIR